MPKPIRYPLLAVRLKAAERLLRYEEELRIKTRHLAAATRQVEDDLAAAGAAQRASLPEAGLQLPGCRIQPLFLPSQHVSGDMFNYFVIADDLVGFYAADVSGHGVRAALVAAMLGHVVNAEFFGEAVLEQCIEGGGRTLRPERLAERLNQRFLQQRDSEIYFTLLCGIVDVAAERVVLCQAGHPHPLLIRNGADGCWLGDGGTPLGLFADAQFSSFTVPFSRGDRLIVTSDGTLEAMSPAGEPFGEGRFLDLMQAHHGTEAGALCNDLVHTLSEWTGGARFHDDISMIILDQWEGSP
jgi:sigma-B regulation protein RsbU (phosphoserine phosphatase)